MGSCCSSGKAQSERAPVYFYHPPVLEREPFSSTHACSQASHVNSGLDMGKNAPVTSMGTHIPVGTLRNDAVEDSIQCDKLKTSNDNGKFKATAMDENESMKCSKLVNLEVEEDCPICLEEYNTENPKMFTKCEHHFHLCCLLEWMERSDVCPMCEQVATFSNGFGM